MEPKSFARTKPRRAGKVYTILTALLLLGILFTYFNSTISYWRGISYQQEKEINQLIKELETAKLELTEVHKNLSLQQKLAGIEGLEKGQLNVAGEVIDVYELLALPIGMDEYYDELRRVYTTLYGGSYSDANLFRVMMVLHDSGRLSLDSSSYREAYGEEPNKAAEKKLRGIIKRLTGYEGLEGKEKIPRLRETIRRNNLDVISSFVSREIKLGRADYPRFPLETVSLRGGDDEDKAMLLAALLTLEGYEAGLLSVFDAENNFYHQSLAVKDEGGWVRNKQMFKGYEREGHIWILIDPVERQTFEDLPSWAGRYLTASGALAIPSTKYVFTAVDLLVVEAAGKKTLPGEKTSAIILERGKKSSVNLLAVVNGRGVTIPLITEIRAGEGRLLLSIDDTVFVTNTQESIATALRAAKAFTGANLLDKDIIIRVENPYTETLRLEGESAGASIAVALIANVQDFKLRQDVAITGTVNEAGSIGQVGDVPSKAAGAGSAGINILLVPKGQGVSAEGLRVVEVATIEEALSLMEE